MLSALVVADDLTGACDTGHEFAARGYGTRVALEPPGDPDGTDVLVVDTDSRYAPAGAAAESVRAAVRAHRAATVYKKVDSTLRGNVASEVDAALSVVVERGRASEDGGGATGGLAVVAPASPATGRVTACGYHLAEGSPVTETEPGRDPEKGPASASLPDLFADLARSVDHVGINTVASGPAAVAEALRERAGEARIVTADATHETHLSAIAAGTGRVDEPAVSVGSAGLAGHAALPDGAHGPSGVSPPADADGVLGVVGSVAPQTLAALTAVPDAAVVALDPETAVSNPEGTARQAAERARETTEDEGRVVLTAATDRSAVDRAASAGETEGLSARETRDRVATALAEAAAAVVEVGLPSGLFLTGGDTAVAVLDALGADAVALSGEAVEAGVPLGAVEGGIADGSALVTKAGAFGGRETVINCLGHLRGL
jgi:uncharacterized protein YgbK (DUF1537 family)